MAAKDNQINLLPGKSLDGTMLPDMSLDNIRKIAQGDLSSALTGGDKLIALSGLLRSVARGSRTTPQEAMAQVQQAALGRASTQMQLAQLQAAQEKAAQLKLARDIAAAKLPGKFREQYDALDESQKGQFFQNLRINPSYKTVTQDGKVKTVVTYGSGLTEDADFQLPEKREKVFLNGKAVWINTDTWQYVTDPVTGQIVSAGDPMTPKETADVKLATDRYNLAVNEFNLRKTRGDGPGRGREAKDIWVAGPNGKPMKVRGVSVGGNSYNVGGRVVQAVPSPVSEGSSRSGGV